MQRYDCNTLNQLSTALCDAVATNLAQAIAERGVAVLVLSGGRTPRTYLPTLFSYPLAWDNIYITLSDERWVPTNHADSNEFLVRSLMPDNVSKVVSFIGLWADTATPEEAMDEVTSRLAALPKPFDVAILGMGEDGHFASLFPGTGAALSTAPICLAVSDAPLYRRMSLSPKAISATRHIYLAITGETKLKVLDRAAAQDDTDLLPVRSLVIPPTGNKLNVYSTL